MMTKERILLVDDEPNVLAGYRRNLRHQFKITTAESGAEAIEIIEKSDSFAVIVSDMRMPLMNGVDLLKRVKKISPNTVRMMLTGNADQETAIQAVNHGHIFRFLNKPCEPQSLAIALSMGVRQYHLITAEKELLEKTLKGSIEVLTEILSLTDPNAFVVSSKVVKYLNAIHGELEIENPWELEVAALVSPIGLLTLPPELKEKVNDGELKNKVNEGISLTQREEQAVRSVPSIGSRLLSHIPRLERVRDIVACGMDSYCRNDKDESLSESAAYGLNLLRLLFDIVHYEQQGNAVERAFELLNQQAPQESAFIDRIRIALQHHKPEIFSGDYITLEVSLKKIQIGDELSSDAMSEDNRLLLANGSRITGPFLERLFNYRKLVGVKEPIKIRRFVPNNVSTVPGVAQV